MEQKTEHLFPYRWYLRDGYPAKGIKPNGLKVFGTFICGGGSSMGYKLAGFDHLGGVELDPSIAAIYKANHHPKYLYIEDIRDFNERTDLPDELYQLDILDGSPPCSTFSMCGSREKAWGKNKRFAEGQKKQRLDDLVFVYCETINKLQPRTFLLENVSGLIKGNAKAYTREIIRRIDAAGYTAQVFLLNAATMGVPQQRERVFIIGHRKEIELPKLILDFNEPPITFGNIIDRNDRTNNLSDLTNMLWKKRQPTDKNLSDINMRERKIMSRFNLKIAHSRRVCGTLTTGETILYEIPRKMNKAERFMVGTFPQDYQDADTKYQFLTGMSVPPVMTAQIAHQIYEQWLKD